MQQQHYGQVVPFPPAWRRQQQLGFLPVAAVASALAPSVGNWLGNVFGSGNRPAIEDIKAALELGQTISASSWAEAGLPADGGEWYQDWLLQHQAQEANWRRAAGIAPGADAVPGGAAVQSPATVQLSNQVATLQAQIAAMNDHANWQADTGNYRAADAADAQAAAMHRQMMQMQAMLNRTLAMNQQQLMLQQQQQPAYDDYPQTDDSGGWPLDNTQTMYLAAGVAGLGLLLLMRGRD